MAKGDLKTGDLKTGGELLVEALRLHGADQVFCVPGESYLAVLDALVDAPEIQVTACRQEGGAAIMAEAAGKLTGRPGICMVTRGPGATNASAGVHIAFQDSTPMILFIGQIARDMSEREAFQEIDYRRMFGPLAKWVAEIDRAERVPEFVARAFATATSGRPGPVVLALPEDMLRERVEAKPCDRYTPVQAYPGAGDMTRFQALLEEAERPLAVVGGGGWTPAACAHFRHFAEAWDLPVGASFRCQSYLDNEHPNYVGHVGIGIAPYLRAAVTEADLLVVVGARMGEITSDGYSLLDIPKPRQRLVHVYPGAEELGRVYQAELPIHAGMPAFAEAAAALTPVETPAWTTGRADLRAGFEAWSAPLAHPGPLQLAEVMTWLRGALPPEAIVTNGAGNYSIWLHRFYRYRQYRGQLGPTSGSMGYGVPAAVAAKRLHPERPVVAFAGDGCFQMTGQELGTAVQYGANIVVVVINNAMWGTIRMHQERSYPGRVSATDLVNPDFAKLAEAYGAHGEVVECTEDFQPAFERARAAGRPALIELRIDPEAITPSQTLSEMRAKAAAQGS
jgi:acetolactate synthase-1/2/3 large subunit